VGFCLLSCAFFSSVVSLSAECVHRTLCSFLQWCVPAVVAQHVVVAASSFHGRRASLVVFPSVCVLPLSIPISLAVRDLLHKSLASAIPVVFASRSFQVLCPLSVAVSRRHKISHGSFSVLHLPRSSDCTHHCGRLAIATVEEYSSRNNW
jgi:hypothetical protein